MSWGDTYPSPQAEKNQTGSGMGFWNLKGHPSDNKPSNKPIPPNLLVLLK